MASKPFVVFDRFSVSNLKAGDRQEKTAPAKPGQTASKYNEIPLFYAYSSPTDPAILQSISSFRVEFPELHSDFGLNEKVGQSGKNEYTIMCRVPQKDDTAVLLEIMRQIHGGCAEFISAIKGALGMFEFNKAAPTATGFKSPVVYPRDKVTGEIRAGFDPTLYLKLFKNYTERTLFTDIDGKSVDWELLKGTELSFIPLMEFTNIYIGGGKASLQMKMISAVITSVVKKNTETSQKETIERLKQSKPEAASQLRDQLLKLKQLQENRDKDTDVKTDILVTGAVPTAAGTAPPVVLPQMPPTVGLTQLPTFQAQPSPPQMPTMQNFLQGAPTLPQAAIRLV